MGTRAWLLSLAAAVVGPLACRSGAREAQAPAAATEGASRSPPTSSAPPRQSDAGPLPSLSPSPEIDAGAAPPPAWVVRCTAVLEAERARLAQHYAPFRRLAVESDLLEKHQRVLLWGGYGAKPLIAVSFEEDPAIDAAQSRPWQNMYYECPSDEERVKPERVRVYVGGIGRVLVRGFNDDATIAASLRAAVDTCGAAVAASNR